jgi:sugar phosphate isomerase/epimerase
MRFIKNNFLKFEILLICLMATTFTLVSQSSEKQSKSELSNLTAYNFGSFGRLAPIEQIKVLKVAGYKGIILNSQTREDSVNLNFFIKELRNDKQFNIHALMIRYNFNETEQVREKWKMWVDKIAGKNIELWVIFGKKLDGINDGFIESKLREIVKYAKSKKIKVILYPHSTCYIASAEEALPFVKKINDKNLQLAVHLCHEIRAGNGDRISTVFENVKPYIGAVTLAGTDSVADFSKPKLMDASTIKPIGQGNFDMKNFIEPLLKSDYKGKIGFINFKIEDDPEIYLKSSIIEWNKQYSIYN